MIPPGAFFLSLRKSIKTIIKKGSQEMSGEEKECFRLIYALSLLFVERDEEIEKMLES